MRMTPELESLIRASIVDALREYWHASIGIVRDFDAARGTCTVQPAIRRPSFTEDGEMQQEEDPPLQNVIVGQWGGAALSSNVVLAAGDAVLLVYLDYSSALWRQRGEVSDAPDAQKNGPSYPIALPIFRPAGAQGPDTDTSIGRPDGMRVHFTVAHVAIGEGGDAVALAGPTNARLDALEAQVALPHTSAAPGSPTVPPPFTPGASDVSAGNLRADP